MKLKLKTIARRAGMLAAILCLLLTVLTGCAGQQTPTLNVNGDVFLSESDELSGLEQKAIANMLASVYTTYNENYTSQAAFVAASRGYDISAPSEGVDYSQTLGVNLEYAKKVITEANVKAASIKNNDKTIADADLNNYLTKLSAGDVTRIVSSFKTSVTNASSGLFDGIMIGIGTILHWLTLGTGNYLIGICLFAIVVEICMIPFAIKQQKNSIKQAKLRPKEMAIRNKYKGRNDQPTMQKLQAEIQELYQRENFSPYSGCLPLLVQLPIIMVLYNIVMDPLHYVLGQGAALSTAIKTFATAHPAAGGLGLVLNTQSGTIEVLSKIGRGGIDSFGDFSYYNFGEGVLDSLNNAFGNLPEFNIGPINLGLKPMESGFSDWTSWILLLVPVLTFVTYFLTSKLNRRFMYQSVANEGMDARQMACSNSMMDITMPLMSTFFTLAVPSVIGIYWAFRSWLGFGKTVIMAKIMPLPTFTEEDYKAAAREMAGKKSNNVKKSGTNGAVRSLHYIDDEDFEDTRERGLARRAALEAKEREEQEKKAAKTPFAVAPVKKEDDKNSSETKKEEPVAPQAEEPTVTQTEEPSKAPENDNDKD